MNGMSRAVTVGALVAFGAFGLGAVAVVSGDQAVYKLGLLFGMFGIIVAALVAALRADAAAAQTSHTSGIAKALDGVFEQRVRAAVRDVRDEPVDSTAADDTEPTSSAIIAPPDQPPKP